MFELVPPKSKIVEYKSRYMGGDKSPTFRLKVFDFEEDDKYTSLLLKNSKIENDQFVKDEKGNHVIDNEQYYIDVFKLGVEGIEGIEGKFTPSWPVIKEIVNRIAYINSGAQDLEK